MSATLKYVVPSDQVKKEPHDRSKVGYFFSESDLVKRIRDATGTGDARHPIALIVEASDDIVYACVDLEDGIKKRLITWEKLEAELLEKSGHCDATKNSLELAKKKIGNALHGFSLDEGLVQAFRTYAITEATGSAFEEFKRSYALIMDGKYHDNLTKQSSAAPLIKACKIIGRRVCYESDEVFRTELMGRKVIQDLLSIFWEGVLEGTATNATNTFARRAFELTSSNYRQIFKNSVSKIVGTSEERDLLQTYCRIQFVCDYIAGMTDSYATNLHKRLTNA